MKTRIITWIVTLGALLDTLYGVLAENSGLLAELGLSPKATKIVLVLGVIWTAFSRSLVPVPKQTTAEAPIEGGGVKNDPPKNP